MMGRNVHPNIEPSLFRADEYVGYDGRGFPWRIARTGKREWVATPGPSHPYRLTAPRLREATLTDLAHRLATRGSDDAAK